MFCCFFYVDVQFFMVGFTECYQCSTLLSEESLYLLLLTSHDDDIVGTEDDVRVGVGDEGVGGCGHTDDDTFALLTYASVAYALAAER